MSRLFTDMVDGYLDELSRNILLDAREAWHEWFWGAPCGPTLSMIRPFAGLSQFEITNWEEL